MKYLFLLIFVFLNSYQTEKEIHNFHLENQTIQYIKVFELKEFSENELIDKLNGYLPTVSGVSNIHFNGTVFTGKIENLEIDFKKYGGKWGTTWIPIQYPMNANLTIQVKDNRYRLLISNIECSMQVPPRTVFDFNSMATVKRGTEISTNKTIVQGLKYTDQFLTDKFNISNKQLDNDW
ncbi:hypothetical protein [Belliella pelovolcani]|uniref:hypothetical protein n=1 Tax=Belliella pelovolcani TaxID=529505 RepID=UPI00391A78BE